jgi:hypothetical protein
LDGKLQPMIALSASSASVSMIERSKMLVSGLEKRLANLRPCKPGQNRHTTKRERIAAKLAELIAEYFPSGGYSVMDEGWPLDLRGS